MCAPFACQGFHANLGRIRALCVHHVGHHQLLDVAGFSEVEASGMYQYGDFEDVAEPNMDPSTADVSYSDPAVDLGSSTLPEQPAQQVNTSAAQQQPSQERPKSAGRRGRPKKGAILNLHVVWFAELA